MSSTPSHFSERLDLPRPLAQDAVYPREEWGRPVGRLGGLPGHLFVQGTVVPEGVTLLATCSLCGGRLEGLVDLRSARAAVLETDGREGERDLAEDSSDLSQAVSLAVEAFAGPLAELWLPRHERCAEKPLTHHTPALLAAVRDARLRAARDRIRAGERVDPSLTVVTRNGARMDIPLTITPYDEADGRERGARIAEHTHAVRALIRARALDVVGVVALGEAWMAADDEEVRAGRRPPTLSPFRREGLFLHLVTPDFGRAAWASITREQPHGCEGPGRLGRVHWMPAGGPSRLVDGVLATTDVIPLPEEEAKRAAGRPRHRVRTGRR
ncbi:MAG TPA: hypothetical protein VKA32_03390 [Gammaproteobacteria bacterium]|nr:hypothetical protein [Gammaproteobacteria bacterium]